jgi:hypothetical protein
MAASDLINNGDWSQAVRIPREVAFQSSMMAPAFAARYVSRRWRPCGDQDIEGASALRADRAEPSKRGDDWLCGGRYRPKWDHEFESALLQRRVCKPSVLD